MEENFNWKLTDDEEELIRLIQEAAKYGIEVSELSEE